MNSFKSLLATAAISSFAVAALASPAEIQSSTPAVSPTPNVSPAPNVFNGMYDKIAGHKPASADVATKPDADKTAGERDARKSEWSEKQFEIFLKQFNTVSNG